MPPKAARFWPHRSTKARGLSRFVGPTWRYSFSQTNHSNAKAARSSLMSSQQGPAMIEAVGLAKYYGDFAAIEDVSFSIPQGQVVAFLGPNGAGKSTTMKLLT